MQKESDLFQTVDFKNFINGPFEVTKTERVVVHVDRTIKIDDHIFDLNDIVETLQSVTDDTIEITNRKMGEMFLKFGVLKSLGSSRWMTGAYPGPNYQEFYNQMEKLAFKD